MSSAPVWSHPVTVADIEPEGEEIELVADEETRAALARFADVLAVPAFTAHLKLIPDNSGGAFVTGTLDATVRQNCVVSLDPFDNPVHEDIAVSFAPEGALASASREIVEVDEGDFDKIVNGVIDLGAVVTEFFVLGIDPYPRKPGVVFTPPQPDADEKAKPFAALEKLKQKGRQGE